MWETEDIREISSRNGFNARSWVLTKLWRWEGLVVGALWIHSHTWNLGFTWNFGIQLEGIANSVAMSNAALHLVSWWPGDGMHWKCPHLLSLLISRRVLQLPSITKGHLTAQPMNELHWDFYLQGRLRNVAFTLLAPGIWRERGGRRKRKWVLGANNT